MSSRFKLFSDPVHGFISVPKRLILPLIETPEFQRLRRIRQLGLGHLVYPGAEHTRFQHALGAMALMQEALAVLAEKGAAIPESTHDAALAVALLHDIGHGPFSHTLESDLIAADESGPHHHEQISRCIIERLNDRLGGALDEALAIFDGTHPLKYLNTLIASQLDLDRLDYLRRDSFYTGVAEGVVGVERIIKTLRVHPEDGPDSELVIESKGEYAVESYLLSRRLMYWQVYLHKTVIAADHLLRSAFARARAVLSLGDASVGQSSPPLRFFLEREVTASMVHHQSVLDAFCKLDDTDLLAGLKLWMDSEDRVLADLSRRFVDRDLFRTLYVEEADAAFVDQLRSHAADWLVSAGLADVADAEDAAELYVRPGRSSVEAYDGNDAAIRILDRDGTVRPFGSASTVADMAHIGRKSRQDYVCVPRELIRFIS